MSEPVSPLVSSLDFEGILEALPQGCALADDHLRLIWCNRTFLDLVGEPSVVGRPLSELVEVEDPLIEVPEQRLLARTSKDVTLSLVIKAAPGGRLITLQALPRDSDDDRIQRALLALSRDVVAATTEDELVGGVARALRELFPRSFFAIRVVDPRTGALTSMYAEGRLIEQERHQISISKSAAEKMGLDPKRLPPERVVLSSEPPLIFAGAKRGVCVPLVASAQLFGALNVELREADGRTPRSLERTLIRAANSAAVGMRNAKLFDEVNYVKHYLEQLIEHANALIVVINRDKRVIVFNAAMAKLSGYSNQEVLGRDLLEFIPEGERRRVQRLMAMSLRGGQVSNFETAFFHSAGRPIRVAFSTATVRSPAGEVEGVIAVGQDLTQLEELERAVIQSEKLASLGQLAAGVAHEINNPLTTISIYADSLVQKFRGAPADPGDVEKLSRILEASGRILKLARDLTSYARPDQDTVELLSINDILDQAVVFCDHVIKEGSVEVVRRYSAELPSIPSVRSNMIQVFVNLITNACHATREGGGRLELSTAVHGGGVEIEVRDSGIGISRENLNRIFEPFFTTKAEGKGTGLGLSIVQGIITKHGGTIDVRSEPDKGTRFIIQLPATQDDHS